MAAVKTTILLTVLASLLLAACSPDDPVDRQLRISEIQPLMAPGSSVPHLSPAEDGSVIMSWLEPTDDGVSLQWSRLDGHRWSAVARVASGDNWFVNWADFPSVTPINGDLWAAHWLAKKPGGTYAYDVAAAISTDAGKTWGEPFIVHDDDSATEHGFVTLFPWGDDIGALWLDGRNMATDGGHDKHDGPMTVRAARFDADANARQRIEIDDRVCDCCQTDVAITASGPIAAYRDRNEGEIRDISVARFVDGRWLAPETVADDGWEIAGCPVNGPAIDARGDVVAVAWFTAADNHPRVKLARSRDAGTTFGAALDIDFGSPIGRVDVVQRDDGFTLVSWMRDVGNGQADLAVRALSPKGEASPTRIVATMNSARISGFPQMVSARDRIVFAWTDVRNGTTRVRSASMNFNALL